MSIAQGPFRNPFLFAGLFVFPAMAADVHAIEPVESSCVISGERFRSMDDLNQVSSGVLHASNETPEGRVLLYRAGGYELWAYGNLVMRNAAMARLMDFSITIKDLKTGVVAEGISDTWRPDGPARRARVGLVDYSGDLIELGSLTLMCIEQR